MKPGPPRVAVTTYVPVCREQVTAADLLKTVYRPKCRFRNLIVAVRKSGPAGLALSRP